MTANPQHHSQLVAAFRQLFDGNGAHACLLTLDGEVLAVNHAWNQFALENGADAGYQFEGQNYLNICQAAAQSGDLFARDAMVGLMDVMMTGRPKFAMTYPCHAPHERRWFRMWVETQAPAMPMVVVAHLIERAERVTTAPPDESSPLTPMAS